jgi:hypothetical protein
MHISLLTSVKALIDNLSTGEIAGYSFAILYVVYLACLLYRRRSRLSAKQVAQLAARMEELRGQPRPSATPIEPGVCQGCDLLPTRIEDLDPNGFGHRHAHLLSGWVSPEGFYYKAELSCGHSRVANRIAGCEFGGRQLENHGWVHLTQKGVPGLFGIGKHTFTREQMETLKDIATVTPNTFFGKAIVKALESAHQ